MVSEGGDSGGAQSTNGSRARRNETRSISSLNKSRLLNRRSAGEATEHEAEMARMRSEGDGMSNDDHNNVKWKHLDSFEDADRKTGDGAGDDGGESYEMLIESVIEMEGGECENWAG